MYPPISIQDVSVCFPNEFCFEAFSTQIYYGQRIGIIGRNGSGKSSLLKVLAQRLAPEGGSVQVDNVYTLGYVAQLDEPAPALSGGEHFNAKLTAALSAQPSVLLLDEPTNHLDTHNRKSLMRMLKHYSGTLIVVTHDAELLRECVDTLWCIEDRQVKVFSCDYDTYLQEVAQKRSLISHELSVLKRDKKDNHAALMKEQRRAKKRKTYGEKKYDGDKLALKGARARGELTSNKHNQRITDKRNHLLEQLSDLKMPEVIVPKFSLSPENIGSSSVLCINDADIGYTAEEMLLTRVNLSLRGKDRIAICGRNGSGKSTLIKGILGEEALFKTGSWQVPDKSSMGYLDQNYANLDTNFSVSEHVQRLRLDWLEVDVRRHLNDFLFRKNEEVAKRVSDLSGGELARLSLACIAAKTPRLLILDEVTNNLDLETKSHVVQVLRDYPGAMILISHEGDFLKEVGVDVFYEIEGGRLVRK